VQPPEVPEPLGAATQRPFVSQTLGGAQSFTDAHDTLQWLASQSKGVQSVVVPSGAVTVCCPSHDPLEPQAQRPVPSHVPVAPAQAPLAHDTLDPTNAPHDVRFVPSQSIAAHGSPAPCEQGAWPVWGAPVTAVQSPGLPETSQASHWPVHAWLQQLPSAQKPLAH
jgi:hypothetical protein